MITMLRLQPGSCSFWWWRTMPACDSVNDVNTPTAYSGISALVMPPKAMISSAGRAGEHEHAVREHEPVAAVGELARAGSRRGR